MKTPKFAITLALACCLTTTWAKVDVDKIVEGTIMVNGTVYPRFSENLPQNGIQPSFYTERKAANNVEFAQMMTDAKAGNQDALANIQNHLAEYLADPVLGPALINGLNNVVDNPNGYGLSKEEALAQLDSAFEAFILTNGDDRNDLDFSRIDLSGKSLTGQDLRHTGITGAQLANVTDLTGANLSGLDLSGLDLTGKEIADTNFENADLSGANLAGKTIAGELFQGANLTGANLSNANLAGKKIAADLTGANLTGANVEGTDFRGSKGSLAGTTGTPAYYPNVGSGISGYGSSSGNSTADFTDSLQAASTGTNNTPNVTPTPSPTPVPDPAPENRGRWQWSQLPARTGNTQCVWVSAPTFRNVLNDHRNLPQRVGESQGYMNYAEFRGTLVWVADVNGDVPRPANTTTYETLWDYIGACPNNPCE